MMYGIFNGYGGWGAGSMMGWFGGGIMMLLFWGAVIYFIVWIVRNNKTNGTESGKKALDILKERYAKGEIEKKEFEEKKKDLI
ncbi:MAG: SHOCT domain-containing protein [Patescibacteria group bacterium]